ncbi:winged helix-turn-helix domain-containing protein [Arcobacter peruensis]|uniref:winged helix-turn-helix domain-containing protein n=1 Tax=Arcobacter peruensis TaxID=2320140 RepID=UPI000F07A5E5|nr:helix-turn-helix domain-containing protein [Arcobacter peruensis]
MKNKLIYNSYENQSLLLISEDDKLINEVKESRLIFKEKLFCTNKEIFLSILNELDKYEIIIFDLRSQKSIISFSSFYNQIIDADTSVLLLCDEINDNFLNYKYNKVYASLPMSIDYKFIINNIELCQIYSNTRKKIDFRDGISFDCNTNSLMINKESIELTKSEDMIIKLLIKNLNCLVEYKALEDFLWKDKNFSKDTLRNKIRNIRKKTNSTFIRNVSKKGYILNSI